MFEIETVLKSLGMGPVNAGACTGSQSGWTPVEGQKTFTAVNPATGEANAQVTASTLADYERIAKVATEAQKRWRMVPAPVRGELVLRIGELVKQHHQLLGQIVSIDTGKSVMEGMSEVKEVIDMATLAAGQSRMLYGFTQQSQRGKHRMYDQWLPLGVVGLISAYNFPAAVWAQNGFLSAIAGNTVIWKPSPKVPLTAIALQHLSNQAMAELGHEGVFSLFTPEDNAVAEQLLTDPRIALVSFTGSSNVGRKVANLVGQQLGRRYMLECSGNNGCIVDETADLKLAARSITFGVVGTTGQRCTSTRRVIVQKGVAQRFTELLAASFAQIKVGDPREKDAVVGPLIDKAAVGHFEEAVAQAVALGGKVVFGGKRMDRPGYFVEPTIITGAKNEWPCVQHETFAPIVYIVEYDQLDEAIEMHNGVVQGLASGIHSQDISNIELFLSAAGSDCGIAKVNMGTTGADVGAAFGGEKETGGGRTAGSSAWQGYMRRQSVCINWSRESPWDQRIQLD
ncbi:aldehyde dehydrogenase family protein [uncultured Hydrogenophaga sp.]|uniref:aldehyde dehydrogenase family protein n=1 Tax=uncultured Hydrogenophaga sp. TaxID=199683 RepID=UPI00258F0EBD|nr:aldehyde dehydrogenase family protein [uncultured Hydrogenophaga sp.]